MTSLFIRLKRCLCFGKSNGRGIKLPEIIVNAAVVGLPSVIKSEWSMLCSVTVLFTAPSPPLLLVETAPLAKSEAITTAAIAITAIAIFCLS